jgi:hypothetical protein
LNQNSSDTTNILQENIPDVADSVFSPNALSGTWNSPFYFIDTIYKTENYKTFEKNSQESVFVQHNLQVQDQQPVKHSPPDTDLVSGLLILCLVLLAFSKVFYNKRLEQIFFSFFSSRLQNMMERDGHLFKDRISIPLFFVYIISFSLFIHQSLLHFFPTYNFHVESYQLFFLILPIVVVIGIIKILFIYLFGVAFKSQFLLSEVIVTNLVFNMIFGILLLPILVFAIYLHSSIFLNLGIFLWLFVLVFKILRQLIIRIPDTKFSLFNRFVYLCTFEIAPAIVIIELVFNKLQ